MNTNDLNTALYEKMAAEQDKYRDWLKSQPPEEILHHTYEYTVREDIVMAMEELELTDTQAQALLESPSPLADVYRYFEKLETGYMDVIRDSIESRANEVCREPEELNPMVVYLHSASYATKHGETDAYWLSDQANFSCKVAIEQAISAHYRDNRLDTASAVQEILEEFGAERLNFILANTIQHKDADGRISRDNKTWAQTIPVCEDKDGFGYDRNVSFVVDRSHPGLMDLFLTQARDLAKEDFKMNQEFMSRNQVEFIRQTYPPNTRILLQHMDDPYAPVPTGTRGTVKYVDDIGQIGVAWDNGRSLSLIPGMDTYRKLTQQELTQEQGEKPSIHDSLGKHAGQQAAHSDKPKMKKEQTR